ncbi:MAG: hypothetical protein KDB80_09990, partial [Planctomycetes bacterium]|nr:hypothetical protein [Planctomycetota bacterium]
VPLTAISPLFADSFLASTVNDPDELDINCDGIGDVETGWFRITTRNLSTVGGVPVLVQADGILGAITSGPTTTINGARLLWESGVVRDRVN